MNSLTVRTYDLHSYNMGSNPISPFKNLIKDNAENRYSRRAHTPDKEGSTPSFISIYYYIIYGRLT